jgi:tetratricopeptide (TPR) repeat protein
MTDASSGSRRRLLVAYADSSRDLAAPLARALEAAGFDVVFPASEQVSAAAMDGVDAVIVCWTPAAVASDMVNLQAGRARRARKLVPVMLAPCRPPADIGRRAGITDLTGWTGDPGDLAFLPLAQSLHARFSGKVIGGQLLTLRYLGLGGAGAASLAAIALIANAGGLKQAYDSFFNPGASEQALSATDAKVDEVLVLLKGKSGGPLTPGAETALRESIARLLSAQEGARGNAAEKLYDGDVDGALADLNAAALEGEKAATGLAETWKEIGALAYSSRTWDAVAAYQRAAELAPRDVVAHSQLGNLYMRAGWLDEAEQAFIEVLDIAGEDDLESQAFASGSLGQVALRRGEARRAETYINQALEIDRRIGNLEGQAADLSDLGRIHQDRGNLKIAETMYRQAIDLQVKAGNPIGHSDALGRLGHLQLDRSRLDEAQAAFLEARSISERENDIEGRAFALAGLADVASERRRSSEAVALYLDALALAEEISLSEVQANTLVALGGLAEERGDKTEAIERFRGAMIIYREMGLKDDVREMQARLKKNGATPSPEGPEL